MYLAESKNQMKRIIQALFILLTLCSCGNRRGAKQVATTPDPTGVAPVNDSNDTCIWLAEELAKEPHYIRISREWKVIDPSAFVREAPSEMEVERWKAEFEKVYHVDSVWTTELGLYKSLAQYLCNTDLIEILHGAGYGELPEDDRRMEWRLLQYAGEEGPSTASELDRILHLKEVGEDLLDRELGSQWDINMHSWLVNDIQEFYIRLMYDKCIEHLGAKAATALRGEQVAVDKQNASMSAAYQKIDGSPSGHDGSSYPCRVATFGATAFDMEIGAIEPLLRSLLTGESVISTSFLPLKEAKALVEKEYYALENTFQEDKEAEEEGIRYTVKVRKEAMERDRRDWRSWLAQREKVSRLLEGPARESYDNATIGVCRHKLIMLKNRYESGTYVPEYYNDIMLGYDASTEEILSHNFEELTEKALNDE